MGVSKVGVMAVVFVIAFLCIAFPAVQAQAPAPAPGISNDGTSIDQGIAYLLMGVALALTYLIHSADISCS